MIKVIKRNGNEVEFKPEKLNSAIEKANMQVSRENRLTEEEIAELVDTVVSRIPEDTEISVEDIQDMVEEELYDNASFALTKAYSNYRFLKGKLRDNKFNDLEKNIMALFEQKETDASVENANKNAKLLSTQRDLAAGEISRHLVNKYILPREVQEAHQKGIIHVHDLDYRIAGITNCGLVNLEDIFTNCGHTSKPNRHGCFSKSVRRTKYDPNTLSTLCRYFKKKNQTQTNGRVYRTRRRSDNKTIKRNC